MGVIKDTAKKLDLAGVSQEEKVKALAECYAEIRPEMDEVIRKFRVVNEFLEKLDMPRDRSWATMVLSVSEAMSLDLDTPEGMGTAALLAEFQLSLS
jgi:hypothetical protein